ncbi:hypothetical protein JF259_05945 [Snuella sp. CAU 1569]|uniref:Uncharacterized protein n=1 Tax=Snuella sedimenti TaxID=2798802 RepID=A0A8J7JAT2_9FLAO|nr:hypothetical protein [Snuella sedimenti]
MVFKTLTFLLAAALLFPAAIKFAHIFSHHEHEVCLGESTTHLHKLDVDCAFYKFKLSNTYTFSLFSVELFSVEEPTSKIESYYTFLSEYQSSHTSLRGPPSKLIL